MSTENARDLIAAQPPQLQVKQGHGRGCTFPCDFLPQSTPLKPNTPIKVGPWVWKSSGKGVGVPYLMNEYEI